MHWKRVTCELHDSYFRLMTIKHTIPKILSGRLNYYITRWRQEVSEFGPDPLVTRCGRESRTQRRGPPGLRLCSPGERGRHNADGHQSGGQYIAVLFGLQLPLTRNLSNKVRGIFFKEVSLVFIIASICILHVYVDESAYDYTTLVCSWNNSEEHFCCLLWFIFFVSVSRLSCCCCCCCYCSHLFTWNQPTLAGYTAGVLRCLSVSTCRSW